MSKETFVYVTYIASTPAKIWEAITKGDVTRRYWKHENVSDWKPGSKWEHVSADGARTVKLTGKIVESVPDKRLVMTWVDPSDRNESRVTFTIEKVADMVRLTVTHEDLTPEMRRKIESGWARVLSSMKSYLETGKPLDTWAA
ncbi:MAG TPA: SRPBCC family protein [Thermoanaerobaculia bacterium]